MASRPATVGHKPTFVINSEMVEFAAETLMLFDLGGRPGEFSRPSTAFQAPACGSWR